MLYYSAQKEAEWFPMFNADELTLLYKIARALGEDRDYGELLTNLLDRTIESLGADRGFVLVRENGSFRAAVGRQFCSGAPSPDGAGGRQFLAASGVQASQAPPD